MKAGERRYQLGPFLSMFNEEKGGQFGLEGDLRPLRSDSGVVRALFSTFIGVKRTNLLTLGTVKGEIFSES